MTDHYDQSGGHQRYVDYWANRVAQYKKETVKPVLNISTGNTQEDLDAQLAKAEAEVQRLKVLKEKSKYPIKTKFHIHSCKEGNYETGQELGLTGAQLDNFRYAGYEVEFDIEIGECGTAVATHVNGVALVTPVVI